MKKGYFLIESLLSIVLIVIVFTFLMPNIISSLKQDEFVEKEHYVINYTRNIMEDTIGKAYHKGDMKNETINNKDLKTYIIVEDLENNLKYIEVKTKRKGRKDVVFKKIIKNKGLYIN
ncbi:type II secretion system GspH family protein [Peptoniphilus stercorisuis]|uniref:Type II secretory pathway pseudopilin PulG n=1 Tax=Peptoniphilus stercorisuis TaxID=1436965 RepID=A0ABS4KB56_9FIRM|nr:type II secretion system GspH family protein [Peptoniphilus stercorisuis]MBP2025003.1 type II secretory pathway pseudopilin PulG [Peptoniphilus stercorisuis]